ncbi:hypothetical protein HOY82DRAFT_602412 [Tuber indicum]|nr:hypothetical protein HOY82DRAFT_602412 [Tuber indicum]
MSLSTLETSLLATFDSIRENDYFSFGDNESDISILDSQSSNSTPRNTGSILTDPSHTDSPAGMVNVASDASPEGWKIEETNREPSAEKVTKKRKSWGQELPIPTTNLPPRKRAKTDAEKEQRRIERVLRNRAAAQSSRERKEKERESLEVERAKLAEDNIQLKDRILSQEAANTELRKGLEAMKVTLKRYEEYLKVAPRETSEPSTEEDAIFSQLLLGDAAAPVAAHDPCLLEWESVFGQTESIMGLDYHS